MKLKKYIDKSKGKIALWLLTNNKTFTAMSIQLSEEVQKTRCIHCGKNPYFKEKR